MSRSSVLAGVAGRPQRRSCTNTSSGGRLLCAALTALACSATAAPVVARPIPPQELVAPGDAVAVSLAEHFQGEGLAFLADSDRPEIATAAVADGSLVVTANAAGQEGEARITVVAVDADGERASLAFAVAVTASPRGLAASWRKAVLEVAQLDAPIWPGAVALLDAVPNPGVAFAPGMRELNVVHLGSPKATFDYPRECQPNAVALRRSLVDLSRDGLQAIDHHIRCELEASAAQAVTVEIEDGPDQFEATLEFATTAAPAGPALRVLATHNVTRAEVNGLFGRYVEDALLDSVDSRRARIAAEVLVDQIARRTWRDLRNPRARYGVVAQRVAYLSEAPNGERSTALTGLVAMPNVDDDFERRDRVVILSHATGSTPSAFRFTDTWFVLANMIAGRGFLVVAPDNWGRGEGTSEFPETYLLANRTANNSLDLVRAVLSDAAYRRFHGYGDGGSPAAATVFGYSQGGHSAFALWLAMQTRGAPAHVRDLHIGGAPHDLYQTLRGTLQALAGRCDGNPWCRHVNETVVPYATGRILPGLLAYVDTGLTPEDVIDGTRLNADFVAGMLGTDARYDSLKAVLQLNSFTNLVGLENAISSDTRIHLYHSEYDRLVPQANTLLLANALAPHFDATLYDGECDSDVYEALFELIPTIGVLHAICGMEIADEVLQELR